MTSISVTLIRGTHSDFDVENLEALRIIRLNNQGIVCIDNLEVFSHITELHLADNGITTIENIDFLDNLAFLDLSNNLISSDSLISSIGLMPKNIKTINLSGNPCANDDSALIALSDSCPGLDIIVGVYAGGEIIDAAENSGLENTNKKVDFSHQNNEDENQSDGDDQKDSDAEENDDGEEGDMPLNADEVLKSLVERKCRLQSLEMFSVTRTTEVICSSSK